MKLALPTVLAVAILLTGCGADEPAESAPSAASTTESPSPPTPSDPCEVMFGSDEVILDAHEWSYDVLDESYPDEQLLSRAEAITTQLVPVVENAPADIKTPASKVFDALSGFVESGGDRGSVDAIILDFDIIDIYTACGEEYPEFPGAESTEEPEPTPAADATFESEFLAAGIEVPPVDDSTPEEYGAYAAESLCRPGLSVTSQNFRQLVEIWTGGSIPEDEAKTVGKGEDFTRLVIKYHCPDRMDGLDALIGSAD